MPSMGWRTPMRLNDSLRAELRQEVKAERFDITPEGVYFPVMASTSTANTSPASTVATGKKRATTSLSTRAWFMF